jgi:hypothetical protein
MESGEIEPKIRQPVGSVSQESAPVVPNNAPTSAQADDE